MLEALALVGHKLQGGRSLLNLRRGAADWLLVKRQDRFADRERNILGKDRSTLSGRRIEDLQADA